MNAGASGVVLLGPADARGTLAAAVADLEASGRVPPGAEIALVTAGWREREAEPGLVELPAGRSVVDLRLYERSLRIAAADPELARGHREVRERLKLLRRAYNVRLAGRIDAHLRLLELRGDESVLGAEREEALAAIRRLDARQLERVAEMHAEFEWRWAPAERDVVRAQRHEVMRLLEGKGIVVIAGGHVATLLDRLRKFGGPELFAGRAVIGRSAGAMVLAERVVLFHDRPPWGGRNPEVFDAGLGLAEGLVALPHASVRLHLDDRVRAGRLAARFAPATCVLLDPGRRIDLVHGRWHGDGRVQRLDRAGRRVRFRPAA
ncbi:hypothetical protein [Candidatus Palauibacter sp.]|uniref:hypothetical protein n=1 Tax=Candidatus Palauibacter sp. TaxID=3101350 RepID=UPI003B01A4CB